MAESLRLGTTDRKLDAVAVQQGLTRDCPHREGLKVTILPAANFNPRFQKAVQEQLMAAALRSRAKKAEEPNGEANTHVWNRYEDPQFIATALVSNMDGLYGANNKKRKYTPALGAEIFADPSHWDVKQWVVNEALDLAQFYVQEVQAEAKN